MQFHATVHSDWSATFHNSKLISENRRRNNRPVCCTYAAMQFCNVSDKCIVKLIPSFFISSTAEKSFICCHAAPEFWRSARNSGV